MAFVVDALLALDDCSLLALDDDSIFLMLDAGGLHASRSAVPSLLCACQWRPRHLAHGRLLSALVGGGRQAPRCMRRWPPPVSSTHARGEREGTRMLTCILACRPVAEVVRENGGSGDMCRCDHGHLGVPPRLKQRRGRTDAPARALPGTEGSSACRPGRSNGEGGRCLRRERPRRRAGPGAPCLATHRIRMGNVRVWFLGKKKAALPLSNM
jgi:hypothetical protein